MKTIPRLNCLHICVQTWKMYTGKESGHKDCDIFFCLGFVIYML